MYYVIHSTSPYLLARFCTELQMEGWDYPKHWEEIQHHPFYDDFELQYHWLYLDVLRKDVRAHNHPCVGNDARFTLTASNYCEVLQTVLAEKGGEV